MNNGQVGQVRQVGLSGGSGMGDYLASLARLVQLGPLTLFPADGPVITDPIGVLTRCIGHRQDRERQAIDELGRGRATVPADRRLHL